MLAKKILFACVPADGHFSPLTGIAMHLKASGHDVRWYTGSTYAEKIHNLGIPYYPFKKALEINQHNVDTVFPERKGIKNIIKKIKFDFKNIFIERIPEYYEDMKEINAEFDFDVLVCDVVFGGSLMMKELHGKKVVSIGVFPLVTTSKDLPPTGMGMTPSYSFFGRKKQDFLRFVTKRMLFAESTNVLNGIMTAYNMNQKKGIIFDILTEQSDLLLQSGVPGLEYKRSDLGKNVHFVGPLLPYKSKKAPEFNYHGKLGKYQQVILVTQGTVERDVEKIIDPTLEAFKDSGYLVIATTGGSQTEELKKRFPQSNMIIEDFIDFDEVMPLVHVFVTNGGYGGTLLGLKHKLPLVIAGVHEGKNEIAARIGYFGLGLNLRTENPSAGKIKEAVVKILTDKSYKTNVEAIAREFQQYQPASLVEKYINELFNNI